MVVDELARRHSGSWKAKFAGQMAEIRVGDEKLALLKPETYMNDSGRSVGPAAAFFKLDPADVLVVHDEGDFDLGRIELKDGGGLAGHNGLRSIADHLGTRDFLRLRIGVGRPERGDPRPLADWVLANFEPHEHAEEIVASAAEAVETLAAEGLPEAQLTINRHR
jgi:PTH1 family peptidyl-tRNA hydrolase